MEVYETLTVTEVHGKQWADILNKLRWAQGQGTNIKSLTTMGGQGKITQLTVEFARSSVQYGKYTLKLIPGAKYGQHAIEIVRNSPYGSAIGLAGGLSQMVKSISLRAAVTGLFTRAIGFTSGMFFIFVPLPVLEHGMRGMPGQKGGSSPMT